MNLSDRRKNLWRCTCSNNGVSVGADRHASDCVYLEWVDSNEEDEETTEKGGEENDEEV